MPDSFGPTGISVLRAIKCVIIIVGVLGNSLNIAVLTRPKLHHHACSRYFLALASNNLFNSGIILIYQLLATGYQINLSNYSTVSCKLINYISTISAFLTTYLIVCASIDRYCTSSTNALIRRFSNVRIAQRTILIVIAVLLLFFIHILVLANLNPEIGYICVVQANSLYTQVYIITQVFLFAVVPPTLMIFFGLMTIRNSKRTNVAPIVISRFKRTEYQLARMLFIQVTVHLLLTLPSSVTYLISALPNTIRTTPNFAFASTICQVFFSCCYVTSFFLYILSSRIYRQELFKLVYKVFRIRCSNQVQDLENQTIGPTAIESGHTRNQKRSVI